MTVTGRQATEDDASSTFQNEPYHCIRGRVVGDDKFRDAGAERRPAVGDHRRGHCVRER
ncbi:hypothetical protein BVI434_1390006 [Burkholderia vietnamiensis]|nr:hypothetical protein BVI434_1390006 [Burkholderia vietnamiensis]